MKLFLIHARGSEQSMKTLLKLGICSALAILFVPAGIFAFDSSFQRLGWFSSTNIFDVHEEYQPDTREPVLPESNAFEQADDAYGCIFTFEDGTEEVDPQPVNIDALKDKLNLFVDKGTKLLIRFINVTDTKNMHNSHSFEKTFHSTRLEETDRNWSTFLVFTVDF